MATGFYRAFEDRHRGSRELIKERQRVYLPFIEPLKKIYLNCSVLDLGCGRGEWLELLLENGFQVKGVDLDEGMLDACRALGLPAEYGEAVAVLESLPDESLEVVSGFHIAEHMPFPHLQKLVVEALRVLKPAGLLILETPNAENLAVGANSFYLDPNHERPIPHLLLAFLTEYTGFVRSKLLRLQENPELMESKGIDLMNVLGGASPDYAITAQKSASNEQLALFNEAFEKEYGLALDLLAQRYEQGLQNKFKELLGKLSLAAQNEAVLSQQMDQLRKQEEFLEHQISTDVDVSVDHLRRQAREIAERTWRIQAGMTSLEQRVLQLEAVFDSTSWRITRPLRVLKVTVVRYARKLILPAIIAVAQGVLKRPWLRRRLAKFGSYCPQLFARLRKFAIHRGLMATIPEPYTPSVVGDSENARLNQLTPQARAIYQDLKRATGQETNH